MTLSPLLATAPFLLTLSSFGGPLLLFGGIIAFIASVLLIYRAFRESLGWGLICILLPLATLLFLVRFWPDMKDIARLHLIAICMLLSGLGLKLLVVENRDQYLRRVHSQSEKEKTGRGKFAQAIADAAAQERAPALREEKLQRAKELFQLTQTWHGELVKKQPAAGAPQATVEAFNKEYANYQGLLGEYKTLTAELQQSTNSAAPASGAR
jgi:hypothetical protein